MEVQALATVGGAMDEVAAWEVLAPLQLDLYDLPGGSFRDGFIRLFITELQGWMGLKHRSERPLLFLATMLQRSTGIRRAKHIRQLVKRRMK